jgi:hypothetical protein
LYTSKQPENNLSIKVILRTPWLIAERNCSSRFSGVSEVNDERIVPGGTPMQRSRKIAAITAGLAVFAIASAALLFSAFRGGRAAAASPAEELISELPPGAPTLVYLDLAAVRASTFYQHRPNHAPITVPDRNYAEFVQSTGFNFENDLDRVVIAAYPAGAASDQNKQESKRTVMVAEGRFDHQKIHDYALRKGKLDHQQGHDVYMFATDNAAHWNSMFFLDDRRIALVEGSSIAPVLDRQGNASAADPARDRAARVAGAAVFAITRVPAVPDNAAPAGAQSAQLMSLARSVQWLTAAARPEGDDLRVSIEAECKTDVDARQLQSTLQVLRMFGQAGLESPKTRQSIDPATLSMLETLLKTADVTQSAERVRVLVELTPDIFNLNLMGPRKTQ